MQNETNSGRWSQEGLISLREICMLDTGCYESGIYLLFINFKDLESLLKAVYHLKI